MQCIDRRFSVAGLILGLFALLAIGCGDDDSIPSPSIAPTGDVQVRMDFARTASLYDAPFPSADLHLADGHVDVTKFPNPSRINIINQALALISRDADGFSSTSAIFFSMTGALDPNRLPAVADSRSDDSPVFLLSLEDGVRVPVHVDFVADGGPFGAENLLSLLPYQGIPLAPRTRYAAVVCAELLDAGGLRLRRSPAVQMLAAGQAPAGLSAAAAQDYLDGYRAAASTRCTVAGLSVFTTGSPAEQLATFVNATRQVPPPVPGSFTRDEVFDDYCVYSTTIEMPDYQQGTAPYPRTGGDWRVDSAGDPIPPHFETARMVVTVPRQPMPAAGYPLAVLVRAGAGGDRPLVDRGVQGETGGPALQPGSGPALEFARVGYAGAQVDGPLGGLRNTTHGDEQFLIFNVFNLAALRDNIRENALELTIFARVLDELQLDTHDCPGAAAVSRFDPELRALMGHSTGATIAPLAMAVESSFRAAIFSGEGGSYIENVLHKRKPAAVLPVANMLLRYGERTLTENDPALSLVQWAVESSDPPVYAEYVTRNPRYRTFPAHVLMLQGIVDNYILPNIANSSSLSLGLDLAGVALDDPTKPDLVGQTPLASVLPLSGRGQIAYPARCNRNVGGQCVTAVVVQHAEDGIEDGHEVVFQTEPPKFQYRCFLQSLKTGSPSVPALNSTVCDVED